MNYRYQTTPAFRKSLSKLSPPQNEAARHAFAIFKANPFDARLRTHKIHALSAQLWANHLLRRASTTTCG